LTVDGWLQIALFTAVIALLVRPLGGYITAITGRRIRHLSLVLFRISACAAGWSMRHYSKTRAIWERQRRLSGI
jgi:nitrate/nitrite transporter NarK